MKIAAGFGKTLLILWVGLLVAAAVLQFDHTIQRSFSSGFGGFIFGDDEPMPVFSKSAIVCFLLGFSLWFIGVVVLVVDRLRKSKPPGR